MKQQILLFLGIFSLLLASCEDREVSFTYSPEDPRAGEKVSFVNYTKEGEEWKWDFGDGSTSSSKSPSKIFRKPGTYTVVLKVDDKASRTCTKTITVHDTMPAISVSDTVVYYYRKVSLTADIYNPYGHTLQYEWQLPEAVKLLAGTAETRTIEVCFTAADADVPVRCILKDNDVEHVLDTTIHVLDTKAPALVLASKGEAVHQRIYAYGYETPIAYPIEAKYLTAPSQLIAQEDKLFVLNADHSTAGVIALHDIAEGTTTTLITNAAAGPQQGFEHGYLSGETLYWTAGDGIYKKSATQAGESFAAGAYSPHLVASASSLGYGLAAGQTAGGIVLYNGIFLYAYDKGVYRFSASALSSAAEGAILGDYEVTCLAIDPVSQKLYFTTAEGLHVSSVGGENTALLDEKANGKALCVDVDDNLLFFTTNDGVKAMPLVHSPSNITQDTASLVNSLGEIEALAIDHVMR